MRLWNLKNMSADQAKVHLEQIVKSLEGIEVEDMTTFELSILRRCCPPEEIEDLPRIGCEEKFF